jgi:GNAT superfamily N-acetyltransferase
VPDRLDLCPPSFDDVALLVRARCRQDAGWWGVEDTDDDEVRSLLERAVAATGSLDHGGVMVLSDGEVVGWALIVGHGYAEVVVDPAGPAAAGDVLDVILPWVASAGGTSVDAPRQDRARLAAIARHGFHETRSSFELERPASGPLPAPMWPAGFEATPFELGTDDADVHALIYSVWTDVPGHTDRPLDEWRSLFLGHERFDPHLLVVARQPTGPRAIGGVAVCRTYPSGAGWVSQLAVGRHARGVGLGRALLHEALARLQSTGVDVLGLSVEAANETALGLYRSAGLAITREWVVCTRSRGRLQR